MPKPTDLPTWATDATYSSGPENGEDNKIEPSADFQEEGWKPGTYPRPEYWNWWQNLVYLWVNWITTFFTIDGSDNLTIPNGIQSATGTLVITGDASVTDDISITGDVTVGGDVLHTNVHTISHLPASATVSGGAYNVGVVGDAVRYVLDAGATVNIEVKGLRQGDRLVSVTVTGDSTDEPTTKQLYRQQTSGTLVATTNTGTFVTNGGTVMTLNTPYTITSASEVFVVRITADADPVNMWMITLKFDHPANV